MTDLIRNKFSAILSEIGRRRNEIKEDFAKTMLAYKVTSEELTPEIFDRIALVEEQNLDDLAFRWRYVLCDEPFPKQEAGSKRALINLLNECEDAIKLIYGEYGQDASESLELAVYKVRTIFKIPKD